MPAMSETETLMQNSPNFDLDTETKSFGTMRLELDQESDEQEEVGSTSDSRPVAVEQKLDSKDWEALDLNESSEGEEEEEEEEEFLQEDEEEYRYSKMQEMEKEEFENRSREQCKETGNALLTKALVTEKPKSKDWCMRATVFTVVVVGILFIFLIFGNRYVRTTLEWLETMDPVVSLVVIVVLFVFNSLPGAWGISLCMLAAGYLYGFVSSLFAIVLSAVVGLVVSMLLLRNLCSNYIRSRFYTPNVEAIINVISGYQGMKVIALTRVTPIPFGLQNALFALSGISMGRYVIASLAGLTPMILTNCYIGSTLRNMHDMLADKNTRIAGYIFFVAQLVVTALLSWFVVKKARDELNKAMDQSTKNMPRVPDTDCNKTVIVGVNGS